MMRQSYIWISLVAVGLSFLGGFLLANAFNRNEIDQLRSDNQKLKTAAAKSSAGTPSLSDDEIIALIERADASPDDLQTQRNIGLALYRYSSLNQDPKLLEKAIPILERALKINQDQLEILITLGNTHFDIGYFGNETSRFPLAREFYVKAIERSPENAELCADIGLTYFLQLPPDDEKAIEAFEKALKLDKNHEKSLQFLVRSQWRQNRNELASKYLTQLKEVNPKNPAINELTSLLMQPPPAQ